MSNIIGYTNDDSDLYYGPNEDSGSFDHIPAGETIYVIGEEEGWYCIECPIGSLSSMNTVVAYGYVPMSVIDIISDPGDDDDGNEEDIGSTSTPHTGYEVAGYYGPDSSAYDVCTTLPESQIVTVLWEEGDYYYVEFMHDMEGVQMRAYVAKDSIEAFDGVPATYTESYTAVELLHNTMGYTGPGAQYATSGEVTTDWAISKLEGTQENGYVLIEHPGDGNRYKRVWIDASAVDEYNVPTPPTPPTTQDAVITNDDADLYYGPGTSYEYCDHIVAGEAVQVLWREGDWYYVECPAFSLSSENARKVCAYIPVSVLVNVSENVENCSAALEEKALISDAPIYGGAGYTYLETDYIDRERTIYSVGGIEQNSFAFVEFCNDYGIFERGWVHTSLIDGDSNEDIDPDEPDGEGGGDNPNPPTPDDTENSDLIAYTNPEVFCYYGPGATGNYDYGDFFEESQEVKICWEEGDYYCIDFETTVYENGVYNHNAKKRMYILKDDVTYSGNAVPSPDMTVSDESIHLTEAIWSYVGPGGDFVKDEQVWSYTTIYRVGDVIENGFVLIEFQSSESSYKRIWINASDIGITVQPDEPDLPDFVAYTTEDADTYFGPDAATYDYCDHLPEGTEVTVLWEEGAYYYIEVTGFNGGKNRMYIHKDSVGSFTGTVPDLTNADYLEVDFTEDVMCYTGPGTNYESKGITSPGGPHTLLRRKSENGFALIDTVAYDNIGMRVWADTNKIILPDLVTYTIDETDGYYGPGSTSYDYCDHLPAGELVTILWKEGDWYYVYVEGDSFGNVNVKRRMYVHKDSVGSFTGSVPNKIGAQRTYALTSSNVSVVSGPAMVYEPIEHLDADTVVWRLGVGTESQCVFIEYTANSGLKRRGWVIKTAVNGFDVLPEVAWDIMGTINTTTAGYYGPNVEQYASAEINAIKDAPVYVLWQEGDWYYINHPTNSSGEDPKYDADPKKNELCTPSGYRKCFYVPTSCVTLESNISVPVHQENKINRPVAVNSDAYAGCGASYSFVGTAYTTDSVKWIDGLCRNGFAFIEYPISNGMYKRGWIPVSKFSDYSPSGFVRIESVRSGFKILEVEPQHIVLTNLGEKMSLKDSGFYGVNGGFFTFDRNSEIYNIATNNDISLLKSFDCFATEKVYDGGRSDSSRTMIVWTGSEIKVENFNIDDELTVDSYKTLNNIQYNTVWRQSGVNLQLGLRDDDYGIHSVNKENRITVKKELIAQFYESKKNPNGLYDDETERTIMVADKVRNKILLIICTENKTIPDIRECLNDILDIPEDGTYCEDIVAICLDGGGSTAMRYSNNDSEGYLTPNRFLMQCIAIV